jgi:RNA polymerase sigma-70 factor (ECF subfamily)
MPDTPWTDVYTEFRPKLERYIGQRVSDEALAEDLTAQVFMKALAAEQQGKGARGHQTAWLYRIAHNLVIDHYRERDRRPTVTLTDDHPADEDPLCTALAAVDAAALHRAIARLPGDQGPVVRLRLDGFTFDEIAYVLNNTVGAVKSLQHRAWDGLRLMLSRPPTPAKAGVGGRVATGEYTCLLCGETTTLGYLPALQPGRSRGLFRQGTTGRDGELFAAG